MIDFHSHILPGIDDGSRDLEESIQMLEEEKRAGVELVFATPHFYAEQCSISRFLQRRAAAFEKVKEAAGDRQDIPELRLGAEVYYFPNMGQADTLPELCLEGTDILLLELPFVQWTEQILSDVTYIVKKRKLRVMLAHIERYYAYQKKKGIWREMLSLPVYLQVNAGSLQNRKKRKLDITLFQEGYSCVMGSDCHNMEQRPPNLAGGREILRQGLGQSVLDGMDERGRRMLGNG